MLRKARYRGSADTIKTVVAFLGTYGLSLATGPLLAHALGPSGRGDVSAVQVPSQLFGYILCFGLPNAALYYAGKHSRTASITISWLFAVVVGGFVVLALWWVIPSYLHGHSHETGCWLSP